MASQIKTKFNHYIDGWKYELDPQNWKEINRKREAKMYTNGRPNLNYLKTVAVGVVILLVFMFLASF